MNVLQAARFYGILAAIVLVFVAGYVASSRVQAVREIEHVTKRPAWSEGHSDADAERIIEEMQTLGAVAGFPPTTEPSVNAAPASPQK